MLAECGVAMSIVGHRVLYSNQPCPYIHGKCETLLHIAKAIEIQESSSAEPLNDLCHATWLDFGSLGYRRQGRTIYRPVCEGCTECVAVRVKVSEFKYTRRFSRTRRVNEDVEVVKSEKPLISDKDAFKLYSQYIESRHATGGMYPPDINTMRNVLHLDSDRNDFHIYGFLGGEVVFLAQTDLIESGLSANYTIFNTSMTNRSLGTFSILEQIECCRTLGLSYLYLGYLLDPVKNMAYKRDFLPQERFIDGRWQEIERDVSE